MARGGVGPFVLGRDRSPSGDVPGGVPDRAITVDPIRVPGVRGVRRVGRVDVVYVRFLGRLEGVTDALGSVRVIPEEREGSGGPGRRRASVGSRSAGSAPSGPWSASTARPSPTVTALRWSVDVRVVGIVGDMALVAARPGLMALTGMGVVRSDGRVLPVPRDPPGDPVHAIVTLVAGPREQAASSPVDGFPPLASVRPSNPPRSLLGARVSAPLAASGAPGS